MGVFSWGVFVMFGCSAAIAAGIFTPFHRKFLGAMLGLWIPMVLGFARILYAFFTGTPVGP